MTKKVGFRGISGCEISSDVSEWKADEQHSCCTVCCSTFGPEDRMGRHVPVVMATGVRNAASLKILKDFGPPLSPKVHLLFSY